MLSPAFYSKLLEIANAVGMSAEDLMAVMYLESGLKPGSMHKDTQAAGLLQIMPQYLKDVGFNGTAKEFGSLDAINQLDYLKNHIMSKTRFNGGPFKSAAQFYVANFWPAALRLPGVKAQNPDTVIIEANPTYKKYKNVSLAYERASYKANAGLDYNHDGKITFGDFQNKMNDIKKSKDFQYHVSQLRKVSGNSNTKVNVPQNDYISSIINKLNDYIESFKAAKNIDPLLFKSAHHFKSYNLIIIKHKYKRLI